MKSNNDNKFVCSLRFTEPELVALLHAYRMMDAFAKEQGDAAAAEIVLEEGISLEDVLSAKTQAIHHLGIAGMKITSALARLDEIKETHEC